MTSGTEQRKLAAIMFTDMVGYSTLAQRHETLALELLEEHRRLLRALFPRFNGTEVKTIGDAFLVEFASALEAAQCAIEIQRTLAHRNTDVPADRQIQVRVGIHIGDVIHREGDVYGDGVNIASRIEQLAGPSGICISMDVERQIRHALEASLVKLPAAELKNIQVPMDLFRIVLPWEKAPEVGGQKSEVRTQAPTRTRWTATWVVLAVVLAVGLGWGVLRHRGAPARIRSLAVKPLDDFSGDTNQAYLSDGMTEALCSALGNISALRVPGRASVMRYKGGGKSIREMAKDLDVDAIVEGSVQRAGNRLKVNVQLIEAATDRHLWSTSLKRDLSDFFEVQSEVARAIAAEIQVRLTPEDQARLGRARTIKPDAIEAYLWGMHYWWQWSDEGVTNALRYFQKAVEIEPNHAPAYAGLALAHIGASTWIGLRPPHEGVPEGKAAAQKAIALDSMLAEAYVALGIAQMYFDWDWAAAENALKRSVELSPNSSVALDGYASFLVVRGRFDEAVTVLNQGLKSDPLSPALYSDLGWLYMWSGRFDQAIEQYHKALSLERNFVQAQNALGWTYLFAGRTDEALTEFQKLAQLAPDWPVAHVAFGYVYGVTGQREKAMQVLKDLDQLARKRRVSYRAWADVYLAMGQKDTALDWLDKAYAERDAEMVNLKLDPGYAALRDHPRFQALLKNVENGGRAR